MNITETRSEDVKISDSGSAVCAVRGDVRD
jgi:hypothetical protein